MMKKLVVYSSIILLSLVVAVIVVSLAATTQSKLSTKKFENKKEALFRDIPEQKVWKLPRRFSLEPLQAPDYVTYRKLPEKNKLSLRRMKETRQGKLIHEMKQDEVRSDKSTNFFSSTLTLLKGLATGALKPVQFISSESCPPMSRSFYYRRSDDHVTKYREHWMRLRSCMPLISSQKSLITMIGKSSDNNRGNEKQPDVHHWQFIPPQEKDHEEAKAKAPQARDAVILPAIAIAQPEMMNTVQNNMNRMEIREEVRRVLKPKWQTFSVAEGRQSEGYVGAVDSIASKPAIQIVNNNDMFQLGMVEQKSIPNQSVLKTLLVPYMNTLAKIMTDRAKGKQQVFLQQMKVTLRRMPSWIQRGNSAAVDIQSQYLRGNSMQNNDAQPWSLAIWDVTDPMDTQLYLHDQFFEVFKDMTTEDTEVTKLISTFYEEMVKVVPNELSKQSLLNMVRGIASVFSTFSASPSAICLACLVILSMFTPLVLNYLCFYIAQTMCSVWHLSDEQCVQMEVASLAVVVVLVLPAAFVIWRLCHRMVCGKSVEHPKRTAVAVVGALLGSLRRLMQE